MWQAISRMGSTDARRATEEEHAVRMAILKRGLRVLGIVLCASILTAQDQDKVEPPPPPLDAKSRSEIIERQRREKEARLQPQSVSDVEKVFNRLANAQFLSKFEGYTGGFRPIFGGQPTGSGFAGGIAWRPPADIRRPYAPYVSASLSSRLWQVYTAGVEFPKLLNSRLPLVFETGYRDSNSISYFGPPDQQRVRNRSNFRIEETRFDGSLSYKLLPHLRAGLLGGYRLYNVGPGQDSRYASVDEVYTPAAVPGLGAQTDYLRYGVELDIDFRDFPRGPKSGGQYLARYTYQDDRRLNRFNYRQLDMRATQYIPFFNEKRVFVLNAASTFTFTNGPDLVPFYLQQTLGGSDDLRGFSPYRFYGENKIVTNAEYRWEIFSGLDGALFFDAGQIADRRSQFNIRRFELSYGIGFRANVRDVPIIRIDIGVSRESVIVWFKFNNFM